uniref:(northern house mosquito) hypothetical protein n=1 Tax=Culex pipiens TaxID=7175 RepID=A0A8D8BVF5_CULPI
MSLKSRWWWWCEWVLMSPGAIAGPQSVRTIPVGRQELVVMVLPPLLLMVPAQDAVLLTEIIVEVGNTWQLDEMLLASWLAVMPADGDRLSSWLIELSSLSWLATCDAIRNVCCEHPFDVRLARSLKLARVFPLEVPLPGCVTVNSPLYVTMSLIELTGLTGWPFIWSPVPFNTSSSPPFRHGSVTSNRSSSS